MMAMRAITNAALRLSVLLFSPGTLHAGTLFLDESNVLAAPCDNDGNIIIEGGEVGEGLNLNCISRGGSITILPSAPGASFIAADGGTVRLRALSEQSNERTLWAQTDCTLSDDPDVADDCNYCACDVVGHFCDAWGHCGSEYSAGVDYKSSSEKGWYFNWDANDYMPADGGPDDYFDPPPPHAAGAHIQGFVRTNDDVFRYAGSHSAKNDNEDLGSIFFIHDDDGYRLEALYQASGGPPEYSNEWHPSGVQILGDYVLYETKNRYLNLINVEKVPSPQVLYHDFQSIEQGEEGFSGGAGIAMTKLNTGVYLLAAAQKGGDEGSASDRRVYFYMIDGELSDPYASDRIYLGEAQNSFFWMENISFISECDSGDIYLVQTSIQIDDLDGYWGLSKLVWDETGIGLEEIGWWEQDRDLSCCDHRSAATTWVNEEEDILFYCHEYKEEETWEGNTGDYYNFRVRCPEHLGHSDV